MICKHLGLLYTLLQIVINSLQLIEVRPFFLSVCLSVCLSVTLTHALYRLYRSR